MTLEANAPRGDVQDDDVPAARRPSLEVVVRQGDGQTRVVVAGELDDSTAPILRERLVGVTENLTGDLVLDIGLLTFVDSTGLALFVTQHKKLQSMGSQLILVSPSPMARRLLQITGLTEVLTIAPPN